MTTPPPPPGWQPQPPPYGQQPHQQQPYQQPYPQQPPHMAPPPQGWHQPPPGWHQPPPVTKRIPEDQPFTARHSAAKRAMFFGVLFGVTGLVFALIAGLAAQNALFAVGTFGCFAVFFGLIAGFQIWLITSGGPALAIGPAGLWIKTRPTRGQAIWLPWEAIERVYQRRWVLDKMLCVKPRDPRTGGNLGAWTALDSGMQQLVFGTGFTAPLNFADRSEAEIVAAVAQYSGGRFRVT